MFKVLNSTYTFLDSRSKAMIIAFSQYRFLRMALLSPIVTTFPLSKKRTILILNVLWVIALTANFSYSLFFGGTLTFVLQVLTISFISFFTMMFFGFNALLIGDEDAWMVSLFPYRNKDEWDFISHLFMYSTRSKYYLLDVQSLNPLFCLTYYKDLDHDKALELVLTQMKNKRLSFHNFISDPKCPLNSDFLKELTKQNTVVARNESVKTYYHYPTLIKSQKGHYYFLANGEMELAKEIFKEAYLIEDFQAHIEYDIGSERGLLPFLAHFLPCVIKSTLLNNPSVYQRLNTEEDLTFLCDFFKVTPLELLKQPQIDTDAQQRILKLMAIN